MPPQRTVIATPAPFADGRLLDELDFHAAFENAPIGTAVLDAETRIVRANNALAEMLGLSAAQLRGRILCDLMNPEDAAAGKAELERQLRGETGRSSADLRYLHPDGQVVWGALACTVVRDASGAPQMLIVQLQDVTERILVEQMLRESEERFRSLTMLASDWYWEQDENFRFVGSTRGTAGVWRSGYARNGVDYTSPVVGKARWESEGSYPLAGTWEEHRAVLEAHLPFRDFQYSAVVAGATGTYFSVSGEPMFDRTGRFTGYRGTARDITVAKLAEQQLREAQSVLQMAAQIGRLGAWTYDVARDEVSWSEEVCKMNEVPRGHRMPGRDALSFYAPYARETMYHLFKACLENGTPFDTEIEGLSARGNPFWVRVICEAEWDERGKVRRMVGACQDVTEHRRAQLEILRLNAELEERVRQRTAQLENANKELESFSYSIAHDLRAPLSSIDGFSRALEESAGSVLGDSPRHYLRRVRAAVRQLAEFTDGLLTLSGLSRGELDLRPVDLAAMASDVLAGLRAKAPGREVQAVIESPLIVQCDGRLIAQLVSNLIGNAWKFTAHTPAARIEMGRLEPQGEGVDVYFVRDNGAGFDMAYATRLFRAFHRMHTTAEFEGNGIGLAIVDKIVTRHSGRVWAVAAPGEGATFFFTLAPEPAPHSAPAPLGA